MYKLLISYYAIPNKLILHSYNIIPGIVNYYSIINYCWILLGHIILLFTYDQFIKVIL